MKALTTVRCDKCGARVLADDLSHHDREGCFRIQPLDHPLRRNRGAGEVSEDMIETAETAGMLADRLRPLVLAACDQKDPTLPGPSCMNGTPMIPLHRATLSAVYQHLERLAAADGEVTQRTREYPDSHEMRSKNLSVAAASTPPVSPQGQGVAELVEQLHDDASALPYTWTKRRTTLTEAASLLECYHAALVRIALGPHATDKFTSWEIARTALTGEATE